MHKLLARLHGLRLDPLKVDWTLALLLTVGAQLAIWLGRDATHHRLGAAAVAVGITAPIAVRRRYPTLVGTGVPILAALDHDLWDAQSVGYPLANFCALYALAVWTPPRRFAVGFALVMAVWLWVQPPRGGVPQRRGGLRRHYRHRDAAGAAGRRRPRTTRPACRA